MFLEHPNEESLKDITLNEFENYMNHIVDRLNLLKDKKTNEFSCPEGHTFNFYNIIYEEENGEMVWKCPLCRSTKIKVKNDLPNLQD